jgi:hypothetical protein
MITHLKNIMTFEENDFAKTGTVKVAKHQVTLIVSALDLKFDSAMSLGSAQHYYSKGGNIPEVSEVYHLAVYKDYAEVIWTVKKEGK